MTPRPPLRICRPLARGGAAPVVTTRTRPLSLFWRRQRRLGSGGTVIHWRPQLALRLNLAFAQSITSHTRRVRDDRHAATPIVFPPADGPTAPAGPLAAPRSLSRTPAPRLPRNVLATPQLGRIVILREGRMPVTAPLPATFVPTVARQERARRSLPSLSRRGETARAAATPGTATRTATHPHADTSRTVERMWTILRTGAHAHPSLGRLAAPRTQIAASQGRPVPATPAPRRLAAPLARNFVPSGRTPATPTPAAARPAPHRRASELVWATRTAGDTAPEARATAPSWSTVPAAGSVAMPTGITRAAAPAAAAVVPDMTGLVDEVLRRLDRQARSERLRRGI